MPFVLGDNGFVPSARNSGYPGRRGGGSSSSSLDKAEPGTDRLASFCDTLASPARALRAITRFSRRYRATAGTHVSPIKQYRRVAF